ncbi:hypothetical protein MCOR02_012118 [Pyricularia oryzae]|nr:hypothetical protein MCOR02_012118 [Pyricularia oryzae]
MAESKIAELERRLRDAEERAEEAEKERKQERQRAEEAEKERQQERQRAEEAEKERQQERQRADARVFENRAFLSGLGKRISGRRISDEKTLESFLHISVEDPVRAIINQLREAEEVRSAFDLGNG